MDGLDALLALILFALCAREVRTVRRLRGFEHRLEASDRSITDPALRREVAADYRRELARGAR